MREEGLTKECIDCGLCTEKCEFLNKYDINLKEFEAEREDLAYNCFICGECKINCPNEIDGRKIVLKMRERSANNGQLESKRYFSTIFEKKNYLFKNYKYGRKKTVLFPGCNFPSFYPDTTRKLIRELKETADIGVVFDCCGKPINELGLTKDADKIVNNIDDKLAKMSVEEIVTLCPNCYYFLKDKLNVNVTDIYKKLCELGMESSLGVKQ
ncbi:MAG: (Fe-S)-binding protein, partial [Lutispora sp.]